MEPEVQEFLVQELQVFIERAAAPESRASYSTLLQQVRSGEVEATWLPLLGRVLEATVESGRLRVLYGPHAEAKARRLYAQTPQGQAVEASVHAANAALRAVEGQQLQSITFNANGPGTLRLTIVTEYCTLQLSLDRSGVEIRSVETGS